MAKVKHLAVAIVLLDDDARPVRIERDHGRRRRHCVGRNVATRPSQPPSQQQHPIDVHSNLTIFRHISRAREKSVLKLAFRITAAADRWLASDAEKQDALRYSHSALSVHGGDAVDVLFQQLRVANTSQDRRALRMAVADIICRQLIVIPLAGSPWSAA
jgi:hypothetical protein